MERDGGDQEEEKEEEEEVRRGGPTGFTLAITGVLGACGMVVSDALEPDFPVVYVNRGFEDATGYRADEVLGRNCRFLQCRGPLARARHPLVDAAVVTEIGRCLEEGAKFQGDVLNFRKDGSPFTSRLQLTPIYGDGAVITHYMGVQFFSDCNVNLSPSSKTEPPSVVAFLPEAAGGGDDADAGPTTTGEEATDMEVEEAVMAKRRYPGGEEEESSVTASNKRLATD